MQIPPARRLRCKVPSQILANPIERMMQAFGSKVALRWRARTP